MQLDLRVVLTLQLLSRSVVPSLCVCGPDIPRKQMHTGICTLHTSDTTKIISSFIPMRLGPSPRYLQGLVFWNRILALVGLP
ncbi:hypothetical protein BJ165DRAFT_1496976 [Panaeolus papilionaceus]|nr:hypothetical protein BJ165DRAFT_1496976 [Panaeolus papilionaceus]